MAMEALTEVKKAEQQACQIIEQAKEDAQKRIQTARDEVKEMLARVEAKRNSDFTMGMEQAMREATKRTAENDAAVLEEEQNLKDRLHAVQDAAIQIVLKTIME